MIIISPILMGVTLIGILPLCLYTNCHLKWMRVIQRTIQTQKGFMNNVAEESFANIRTVRAFCNEPDEVKKFKKGVDAVFRAGRKKAIYTGIYAMLQ